MRLEHVAIDVADPAAFKAWWTANLGMRVSTANDAFLTDDSGTFVLEVYRTDKTPSAPDYRAIDPMTLHIAFLSDDVDADVARLVAAGAEQVELVHKPGFDMAILRDPQGVSIQLVKRAAVIAMPAV